MLLMLGHAGCVAQSKTDQSTLVFENTRYHGVSITILPDKSDATNRVTKVLKPGGEYSWDRNGRSRDNFSVRFATSGGIESWGTLIDTNDHVRIDLRSIKLPSALAPDEFLRLKALAESGADSQAQAELGRAHLLGMGTKEDNDAAFKWYLTAAKQGNAFGQNGVGYCYMEGYGTEANLQVAMDWFRKAHAQHELKATINIGVMFENGLGMKPDLTEAMKWYEKAANRGDAWAQNKLGLMLSDAEVVKKPDYPNAIRWWRHSANQGNANAEASMGWVYANGAGVKKDMRQARIWYQQAAANGEENAKQMLTVLGAPSTNRAQFFPCSRCKATGLIPWERELIGPNYQIVCPVCDGRRIVLQTR